MSAFHIQPVVANTGWYSASAAATKTKEEVVDVSSTHQWMTQYYHLPQSKVNSLAGPLAPPGLSILRSNESNSQILLGGSLLAAITEAGGGVTVEHHKNVVGPHFRRSYRLSVEWVGLHLVTMLLKLPRSHSEEGLLGNDSISAYLKPATTRVWQIVQILRLDDTIILLALAYLDKLFPRGAHEFSPRTPRPEVFAVTIGRWFALGVILAEKMHSVDMIPYRMPRFEEIFGLSKEEICNAEKLALKHLKWEVFLSGSEWRKWIGELVDRSRYCFIKTTGRFKSFIDRDTFGAMADLRGKGPGDGSNKK